MTGDKKGDIVNGAYSLMRISGLTVDPTAEDNVLALGRLEEMCAEYADRNICLNYNFEDSPDFNSPSGILRKYWTSIKRCLALRLFPDFGKGEKPDPILTRQASAALSYLSSSTAIVRPSQYPNRMPLGAGNTFHKINRWLRYYSEVPEVPQGCASKTMYLDDVQDFVESFNSILVTGEIVSSYTLEADNGLFVVSQSLSSPNINYRIRADGNSETQSDSLLRIKVVATTSTGRKFTRIINFQILNVEVG